MKLKTLVTSVVLLAVLSAIVFIARRPGPPPSKDPRVGQPLADRAVVEKAAGLQISDGGKTVTLVRGADGTWRDASYYNLPVDFSKLSGFVDNLNDAKVERFVTANPERLDRLEFKDTKIEVLDADKKPVWNVTVGKSAQTGGRFIKFDDEKKAYLASLNAWIDSDPKSWANATLLQLKPEDIAKIQVGFAKEGEKPAPAAVVLSRAKKDEAWKAEHPPAGDQVKPDKVTSLLSSLTGLRFTDTADPKDANVVAAAEHDRVFTLTTFDGKTYTIALGRKPEEKKLKPPTEGKTGPAALGKVTDLAKAEEKDGEKKPEPAKPVTPEFETIPAGPVFAFITSSVATDAINAEMKQRAFEIADYSYTGLPQKPDEFFEPAPKPQPKAAADAKPASASSGAESKPSAEGAMQPGTPDKK